MDNIWEQRAVESGLRVFPIRIEKVAGKWHKQPLVKRWQEQANFYKLTDFDWSQANGYGILMGYGTYGLDLDLYKGGSEAEAWFDTHNVPRETRTHRTISGGLHRIYSVPTDLPTRANIVPGLDGRGVGGFLAFGDGYEMVRDGWPALLTRAGRQSIAEGAHEAVKVEGVRAFVDGWAPPTPEDAQRQLDRALRFGPRLLQHRWEGNSLGLVDKSRSAMDHSVGNLLAMAGLGEDMIVWVLLTQFQHGAARWKPNPMVAVRAAARSALKGTAQVAEARQSLDYFKQPEMTGAEEAAMNAALRQKSS